MVCSVCLGLFGRQLVFEILEHFNRKWETGAHQDLKLSTSDIKFNMFVDLCSKILL